VNALTGKRRKARKRKGERGQGQKEVMMGVVAFNFSGVFGIRVAWHIEDHENMKICLCMIDA